MSAELPKGTPMPVVVELLPQLDAFTAAVRAVAEPRPTPPDPQPAIPEPPSYDRGELVAEVSVPGGSLRLAAARSAHLARVMRELRELVGP